MKNLFVQQYLTFFIFIGFLVTSCGLTPEQKEDDAEEAPLAEPVVPEPAPIRFDPTGSDGGNIPGLHTIHFAYDKASLSNEAKEKLSQNADWIRQNGNVTLQIEGHCDQRGSLEYNLSLGERRAQTVRTYLIEMGISGERLNTISFGEEKLLSEGDLEEDHRQNRRANFLPLPLQ